MDAIEITIDEMARPVMKFQLEDLWIEIVGLGMRLYQISQIEEGKDARLFLARRAKDASLELKPEQTDQSQADINYLGPERISSLLTAAAGAITVRFDSLAWIGVMKRDLSINESNIERLTQELEETRTRVEKLRCRIADEEMGLDAGSTDRYERAIHNPVRWKASVDLESIWSRMTDIESMREHMPMLTGIIESSGGLFSGTNFAARLREAAVEGNMSAVSNVIDELVDYANEHDIWIRG